MHQTKPTVLKYLLSEGIRQIQEVKCRLFWYYFNLFYLFWIAHHLTKLLSAHLLQILNWNDWLNIPLLLYFLWLRFASVLFYLRILVG